jgi:hypothetical protein
MNMARIQAFEIQDFSWCPVSIRDGVTDWLQFVLTRLNLYGPVAPLIEQAMARTSTTRLIDLCSGGSGPTAKMVQHLNSIRGGSDISAVLTDKYPNIPKFEALKQKSGGHIDYVSTSVDATAVPAELGGFRTLFTSFHHFNDEQAKGILKNAFEKRQPIGIFEFTERSFYSILMTAPTPLMMLLFTPLVWPYRLSRFFWTYVIPLVPLVALFDVIVSVFRTRTVDELLALTSDLRATDYEWRSDVVTSTLGMKIIYLIGEPKC